MSVVTQEGSGPERLAAGFWERSFAWQAFVHETVYDDGSISNYLGVFDAAVPMVYSIKTYVKLA